MRKKKIKFQDVHQVELQIKKDDEVRKRIEIWFNWGIKNLPIIGLLIILSFAVIGSGIWGFNKLKNNPEELINLITGKNTAHKTYIHPKGAH
jgi:hypothetical protein